MIQGLGCQFRTCKISASCFPRLLLKANSFDTDSQTYLKPHLTLNLQIPQAITCLTCSRFYSVQIAGKSMYVRESWIDY